MFGFSAEVRRPWARIRAGTIAREAEKTNISGGVVGA